MKTNYTRNDYKSNMRKERQEQTVIKDILDIFYLEQGYKVIDQRLTEDNENQYKGIDRIVTLTDGEENYIHYIDDKAQLSTSLYKAQEGKNRYIFIPYLREYPNGKLKEDWATSQYKETDIVVMTTADNLAILWDCNSLKESFKYNYDYLANTYGYDQENQTYYTRYNKLEKKGQFSAYEYTAYLILPTLNDLLKEPLLRDCVLAIYDISYIREAIEDRRKLKPLTKLKEQLTTIEDSPKDDIFVYLDK